MGKRRFFTDQAYYGCKAYSNFVHECIVMAFWLEFFLLDLGELYILFLFNLIFLAFYQCAKKRALPPSR